MADAGSKFLMYIAFVLFLVFGLLTFVGTTLDIKLADAGIALALIGIFFSMLSDIGLGAR